MFNINTTTKSLLLVLVMVLAAAGGAMAAAPTVNTETTDTTYTTEIEDGGTQEYNETTNTNFSWSADSENSKIVVEQDNETLYSGTPDHEDEESGTYYYNATLADDGSDYDGLDADAGEDVTLNVTLINDTEADDPDETNVSWTFANGNAEAFADVEDEDLQTPAEGGIASSLAFWSDDDEADPSKLEEETVGIEGNETETITVSVAGTPMADALDASTESTESGDVIWSSAASMDGEYIAVSDSEEPDADWFEDDSTYAVYDDDSETLTYHNVDERTSEDQKDLDLSATGKDGLGLQNTATMLKTLRRIEPVGDGRPARRLERTGVGRLRGVNPTR